MAQKKLLYFIILFSSICLGEDFNVEDLVKVQEKTTCCDKQTTEFINQARVNSLKFNEQAKEFLPYGNKPLQCDPSQAPLFAELITKNTVNHENINQQNLYIFVSLSMPQNSLLSLLQEARAFNGVLVFRGLKENSYRKTAQFLQPIIKQAGVGVIIDPELFKKYDIKVTPTITLAAQNSFDKIAGNISLQYGLEQIAKNGDLQNKARDLLNKKT